MTTSRSQPQGSYRPEAYLLQRESLPDFVSYVDRELTKISNAMEFGLARSVEFLNVAPTRPREGMVRGADGTNWNPGAGQGVYAYYAGAWHKLG